MLKKVNFLAQAIRLLRTFGATEACEKCQILLVRFYGNKTHVIGAAEISCFIPGSLLLYVVIYL